jgi:hypothetical protein
MDFGSNMKQPTKPVLPSHLRQGLAADGAKYRVYTICI